MTDLEDLIRDALKDPRRQPPVWPDPMRRIRRTARRQWAALIAAVAIILAIVVVAPLTLLSELGAHRAAGHSTAPSHRRLVLPSWTKRLPGEVAYKCGNRICLMRPDGTGRRTLTAAYPEWDPAWSPNGHELAFRGYYGPAEADFAIYVTDATGCHTIKLAGTMNGTSPSWSPTGRQIVFARGGINVINVNGTSLRRLTKDTRTYGDDSPAWSADNRIAFVRTHMGTSRGEIYTMNANGSGVIPVTHGGRGFGQPSWSPTGRQIAFTARLSKSPVIGSPMVIEVANANGTGLHAVSPASWASYDPVWTPEGKIVFLNQTSTRTDAYIVNPGGTGLRKLYPNLASAQDSAQIAWGSAALPQTHC
jgi:Tol biopolymer transport system component